MPRLPDKYAPLSNDTWLAFIRHSYPPRKESLRVKQAVRELWVTKVLTAFAHVQIATKAVENARRALDGLTDLDFPKFTVQSRAIGNVQQVSPKRFIANQGATPVKARARTILHYLTLRRCLPRHAIVKGRKEGLEMAVKGIGEVDEEIRKGMDGRGGYIDQIVSSDRKKAR